MTKNTKNSSGKGVRRRRVEKWFLTPFSPKGKVLVDMFQKPDPLPVRKVGDGPWEVLVVSNDRWLLCNLEDDARAIAAAPVYEYESLERTRTGSEFANELDHLADVLEKYKIGFGSRFFRRRAEEARN